MASPTRDLPAVLVDYERHLVSERDLAPHTVRAYLSDVAGLLEHAERLGKADLAEANYLRVGARVTAGQRLMVPHETTVLMAARSATSSVQAFAAPPVAAISAATAAAPSAA